MRVVRRAFTLIELLVVVAIITLLIAILVPSLKKARDQAKSTACLANLKAVGSMSAVYTSAFAGTMVGNYWFNSGQWSSWDNLLQGYNYGVPPIVCPITSPPYPPAEKVFHCTDPKLDLGPDAQELSTYAANMSVCVNVNSGAQAAPSFLIITQIPRQSETIMAGDSNQGTHGVIGNSTWMTWDYYRLGVPFLAANTIIKPDFVYGTVSGTNPPCDAVNQQANHDNAISLTGLRYRHMEGRPNVSGFANVVFVDGHCESLGVNHVFARNLAITY